MPPAPSVKPNRNSMYGWTKKRSVSPSAPTQSSKSKSTTTASVAIGSSSSTSTSHASTSLCGASTTMPIHSQPSTSIASSSKRVAREEPTYFEDDYRDEVITYMTEMDNATLASAELMDMQPELQWFMRPYLIDFLIEVHQQFRLRPEVLFLAMNIVDRYVSKRVVYKKHYQLVGCAALWIAAKFEDGKDKVPLVRELAEMCCKAYDESAFIQMEGHVLSTIGWLTGHPTAEGWLRVYTTGINQDEHKTAMVARFLMEITLFHREFVGIQSSLIAHGSLALARFICGKPRKSMGRYENVAVRIALAIDKHLAEKLDNVSEIVIRKYAPTYYSRASTVAREFYLSGRRYVFNPDSPVTPVSINGLAPSTSWSSKRSSWITPSPSAGSMSCASSDAGDEAPLTPITPIHAHVADPFSTSASKENIAPMHAHSHQQVSLHQVNNGVVYAKEQVNANGGIMMKSQTVNNASIYAQAPQQPQRPALHALPTVGDLTIPNMRNMRRLSN